jgi:hypothetical protein
VASPRPPASEQSPQGRSGFAMIQSVDSVELLRKLDQSAEETGATPEL